MSELIDARKNQEAIRRQLLTTVSMLALLPAIWGAGEAKAENNDTDHPTVWIELGGQLERQTAQADAYDPPFVANNPSSPAYKPISPLDVQKPPLFAIGGEAKLSFTPEGSDWVFSAAVRYGRANGSKSVTNKSAGQHATAVLPYRYYLTPNYYYSRCCKTRHVTPTAANFADTKVTHQDSHTILDFQAGKEVGLGLFGHGNDSSVSAGVRFAQFTAKASVVLRAKPDLNHYNGLPPFFQSHYPSKYLPKFRFHSFAGTAESTHSFQGLGPTISWNSSIALLGDAQAGEFLFDWGANVAVLFGRRKVTGQHHETAQYKTQYAHQVYSHTAPLNRSHAVTVPNVGGFAGVSFKFPNAKVSLGYRGDFFFGAMDTGIDTEKTKTVGFYGPFASISVGFGG